MNPSKPRTSTGFRYEGAFEKAAKNFPTLTRVSATATFGLPGLAQTHVEDEMCDCMTPQGICIAGPYVLITAYCNITKYTDELEKHAEKGENPAKLEAAKVHRQHKSVIYVVDKKTNEHIRTVTLPDATHAGGIAYDGTYIWVAKDNDQKMSAILFSELQRIIDYGFGSIRYLTTTKVHCNASFATTYGDRLFVGNTFSRKTGTMRCFRVKNILGIPRLVKEYDIEMPVLAQGAMMVDVGDKTYLAIAVSGGRVNPSKVYRYEIDLSKVQKGDTILLENCKDLGLLELPPMMEELAIDPETNQVYTQFESASSPYSFVEGNPCKSIVDCVCVGSLGDWFPEIQ